MRTPTARPTPTATARTGAGADTAAPGRRRFSTSRRPTRFTPDTAGARAGPALAPLPGGLLMPATMLAFCDLPDRIRMAARAAIDAAGGDVAGYSGLYVQVAIPNPSGPFFAAMEAAGLELDENS